jgi:hypothetical protein
LVIRKPPQQARKMPFHFGMAMRQLMEATAMTAIAIHMMVKICFFVAIFYCFTCFFIQAVMSDNTSGEMVCSIFPYSSTRPVSLS